MDAVLNQARSTMRFDTDVSSAFTGTRINPRTPLSTMIASIVRFSLDAPQAHAPEAHDENLEVHQLGHGFQSESADLAAVFVHERRIIFELIVSVT